MDAERRAKIASMAARPLFTSALRPRTYKKMQVRVGVGNRDMRRGLKTGEGGEGGQVFKYLLLISHARKDSKGVEEVNRDLGSVMAGWWNEGWCVYGLW